MVLKKEKTWEYSCHLIFNGRLITKYTITDYYRKHLKHGITRNTIKSVVKRLDGEELKPRKKHGKRDAYVWEWTPYEGKEYRLIFWYDDYNPQALWIRNCYPID